MEYVHQAYVRWLVQQREYMLATFYLVYVAGVACHLVFRTVSYAVRILFADAPGKSSWWGLGLFVVTNCLFMVGGAYGLLYWLSGRATRGFLAAESVEIQEKRTAFNQYLGKFEGDTPVVTIFFPDAFEDEYSVAAYTGYTNLIPGNNARVQALRGAAIIANPHIMKRPCSRETAALFTFPEVVATPVDTFATTQGFWARLRRYVATLTTPGQYWPRLRRHAEELFYYVLRATVRSNMPRFVSHASSTQPYACGQTADILKALEMTVRVMEDDPTPNRTRYVLYGVGRGANVIPSVMARLRREHLHRVDGIVLEGLLTNDAFVASCRSPYFQKYPLELPVNLLDEFRRMPVADGLEILVVTSDADHRVDHARIARLIRHLDVKVRVVRLRDATAGAYTTHNSVDACLYEEEALAFYTSLYDH